MKIAELRKKLRWSRADVERELGIPVRTLQNWEEGVRTPSPWAERLVENELERRVKDVFQ